MNRHEKKEEEESSKKNDAGVITTTRMTTETTMTTQEQIFLETIKQMSHHYTCLLHDLVAIVLEYLRPRRPSTQLTVKTNTAKPYGLRRLYIVDDIVLFQFYEKAKQQLCEKYIYNQLGLPMYSSAQQCIGVDASKISSDFFRHPSTYCPTCRKLVFIDMVRLEVKEFWWPAKHSWRVQSQRIKIHLDSFREQSLNNDNANPNQNHRPITHSKIICLHQRGYLMFLNKHSMSNKNITHYAHFKRASFYTANKQILSRGYICLRGMITNLDFPQPLQINRVLSIQPNESTLVVLQHITQGIYSLLPYKLVLQWSKTNPTQLKQVGFQTLEAKREDKAAGEGVYVLQLNNQPTNIHVSKGRVVVVNFDRHLSKTIIINVYDVSSDKFQLLSNHTLSLKNNSTQLGSSDLSMMQHRVLQTHQGEFFFVTDDYYSLLCCV